MSTSQPSTFMRVLRRLWWFVDVTRRSLLNLLFLLVIGVVLWLLLRPGPPALHDKTALVLDFSGPVVEQRSGSARDGALKQLRGEDTSQTRLRDVLAALDAGAKDPQIAHAVLLLDEFGGAGLPTLREMAAAIERFKAAGKPVYAWGSSYDQRQYYLAAHATEVWLHPMGMALFEGYGRYRNYYKDVFDKAGISANVLRVGEFKSAGETFSANAPSQQTLESESFLFDAMWRSWTTGVERARKLPAGAIAAGIEALPGSLLEAGGNAAKLALDSKLVDGLKTRDQLRALLQDKGAVDDSDPQARTFRQVSFGDYVGRLKPKRGRAAVGVIVAEGEISDGEASPGKIGGLSTGELIRRAREDKDIKAVVLRVDSPGGSAFGSELVRRELELLRAAGKPVVVSMGDLAASGGYWISLAADEVIADEATITGSIGVVAMLPTAKAALDKLGVRAEGYTTTWLVGAYDPRRDLDPRFAALVQAGILHVYSDFTGIAAKARKTTPEKIDAVGQGRVWTGAQALERGLVDRNGSYADALQSARKLAKLPDDAGVRYLERSPGRLARALDLIGVNLGTVQAGVRELAGLPAGGSAALGAAAWGLPAAAAAPLLEDLAWLADVAERRKPFGVSAHCLCTVP